MILLAVKSQQDRLYDLSQPVVKVITETNQQKQYKYDVHCRLQQLYSLIAMEQSQSSFNMRKQAPQVQQKKSRLLLKEIKERQSSFKFYNWDLIQNYAYITYLTNFRCIFNSQEQRKRLRVFTHLAMLIKTRNAHQIKSHHQKMMLRHRTIEEIIQHIRDKINDKLAQSPSLISEIQRINKEAEDFCNIEFEKYASNSLNTEFKPRKSIRGQTKKLAQNSEDQVKIEEESYHYIVDLANADQKPALSQFTCLKEEQKQDMIVRISN